MKCTGEYKQEIYEACKEERVILKKNLPEMQDFGIIKAEEVKVKTVEPYGTRALIIVGVSVFVMGLICMAVALTYTKYFKFRKDAVKEEGIVPLEEIHNKTKEFSPERPSLDDVLVLENWSAHK